MHYRILGGTGIEVSRLCLGSMMFGAGGNTDEAEYHRMVATALDAGVDYSVPNPLDAGYTPPAPRRS
ncbi:hypothetical protein ABT063_08255 [Streptomyces sp. NPDC002838]|uniref:hypothetical protein n=1 Tax=Streptomyces sp. NPDC002838 TaxID=3154436 RepID=UPI00331E4A36